MADPQGGEIQVTPEEERFLKRFFRRQLMPWFVLLLALSVGLAFRSRVEGGDATLEARSQAAFSQLRAENATLRRELGTLGARLEAGGGAGGELERSVEEARRNVRAIEARVTAALERRLDGLEARLNAGGAAAPAAGPPAAGGPPDEAAAWDVSAILDRLYSLEMRHERALLEVEQLETRLGRLEGGTHPAAAP